MRSHIECIEIAAPAAQTYEFVADLDRLSTWAIGFAKSVERSADGNFVTTASGERVGIRLALDPEHGVVDYLMSPRTGVQWPAYTRVLDIGGSSLYTFIMLQAPDMPDEVFAGQIAELQRELTVLKAHVESACPL